MKSNIDTPNKFILCIVFLMLCGLTSCIYSTSEISGLKADKESKLVVYGYIFPDMIRLQISRSIPTGTRFEASQLQVDANSVECLLYAKDDFVGELTYQESTNLYIYEGLLSIEESYRIIVSASGLPPVEIANLSFPDSVSIIDLNFSSSVNTDTRQASVFASTRSEKESFLLILPLLEEQDIFEIDRTGNISTGYDAIYQDECGIINSQFQVSYTNSCSSSDTTIIDATYTYPNFFLDQQLLPVRRATPPKRIGIRLGAISRADHKYFKSTRENQNFFEDYLTVEPLDQFNVDGGYGRVIVVNGPRPTWVEI